MDRERKYEITTKFIFGHGTREELAELNVEEIIFLLYSIQKSIEEKEDKRIAHSSLKVTIFTEVLIEKIKSLDCIYIASNNRTRYPLIDIDAASIFTKEEYAKNTVERLKERFNLDLQVYKFNNDDYGTLGESLYVLGIKNLLINEGYYKVTIPVESIFESPDFTKLPEINVPLTNPYLQLNLILFNQYLADYNKGTDEDKKILDFLYKRILNIIYESKFLLPVTVKNEDGKDASLDESGPNGETTLKKNMHFTLESIVNEENNTSWIPAFTDWIEFRKRYGTNSDRKGMIVTIEDLILAAGSMEGVVINCNGTAFTIGKEVKDAFVKAKEAERREKETRENEKLEKEEKIKKGIFSFFKRKKKD
ncbi:SseB family protein [Clostridium tertium]|uniref:SseB family protein n=1 Tax=Clostridium tertium TaxID=1559 RepID=UPI0023B21EE5|nr:SseB family protein [Clostridium tertium]